MAAEDNGLLLSEFMYKGRSASICAFGFPPGSTEHLMAYAATTTASTPPPHRHVTGGAAAAAAAEDHKRRRPAVRSQSARTSGGRSIRKKALVAAAVGAQHEHLSDSRTSVRSGYSDPRLHESTAHGTSVLYNTYKYERVLVLVRFADDNVPADESLENVLTSRGLKSEILEGKQSRIGTIRV